MLLDLEYYELDSSQAEEDTQVGDDDFSAELAGL